MEKKKKLTLRTQQKWYDLRLGFLQAFFFPTIFLLALDTSVTQLAVEEIKKILKKMSHHIENIYINN